MGAALTHTIDVSEEHRSPDTLAWQSERVPAAIPLWIGGIAVLCLLLAFVIKGPLTVIWARADVWVPYLTLGTLFPVLVAAVVLAERAGRVVPTWLGIALTALPIVAVALLAGAWHSLLALGLALGQTVLCLVMAGWRRPGMPLDISLVRQSPTSLQLEMVGRPLDMQGKRVLALFSTGFIAWAVALQMLTWDHLTVRLPPSFGMFLGGGIALLACCWWAFGRDMPTSRWWTRARGITTAVSLLILVLLAFRTDGLFGTDQFGTFFHWGWFVGPAEAVRQGGWLLWDVPIHYGFLSTLSLLALPVPTAWQSLYLVNAIGSVLQALFLFVVLRAVRPTAVGTIVAAAVTAAVVFLLASEPHALMPVHYHPSVGVFRYAWCYVLVGLLLLERRQAPRSRSQRWVLLAGCGCWLLAILWSAESAFYGSAIWLPAFGLIVLRDAGVFAGEADLRRMLAWLAVPPLLLAGMVSLIAAYYVARLGHPPDPRAYVDAALSYSGTYFDESSGFNLFEDLLPDKIIVALVFGFVLLVMAAVALARTNAGLREVPVAMALAFGTWAVSSYAVGQPWPSSIYKALPLLLLGVGILLGLVAPRYRRLQTPSWVTVLKAGTIPLLVAVLVTAYTNVARLQVYAEAIRREGWHGRDVTAVLPPVEPSLARLLQEANVKASDPIFYAGARWGDMMPAWVPADQSEPVVVSQQWMGGPLLMFSFLPDERKQVYMARSTERHGGGGWLIERRKDGAVVDQTISSDPWFFENVERTHVPTKIAQNAEWQLVWYEPKGDADTAALAGERSGRVPGIPADLLIDGQSLSESVLPPVWGYFGPEWSDPAVDGKRRCTSGTGALFLFTPSARDAWLVLDRAGDGVAGTVQVAVNGGEAVAAEPAQPEGDQKSKRGRKPKAEPAVKTEQAVKAVEEVQVPISLDPGWNRVTLTLVAAEPPAPGALAETSCAAASGSALRLKSVDVRRREG